MSPLRLLIIDNEEKFRVSISGFLSGNGYEVASVADGAEALRSLSENKFDLVIAELKMPGLNGIEFLRDVQRVSPHTKVVVLTSSGEWISYLDALEAGAVEYINKPIKEDELLSAVRRVLDPSFNG